MSKFINVSLHSQGFANKPSPAQTAEISAGIAKCATQLTITQFAEHLAQGKTWASLFAGKRSSDTWLGQQAFAADIDKAGFTLAELIDIAELHCIEPAIIHESFSSTLELPKWRVIFVTEQIVRDRGTALGIQRKLAELFDGDPAVCDLARIYYGTNKQISYASEQAVLDLSELGELPIIQFAESAEPTDFSEADAEQQKAVLAKLQAEHPGRFELICRIIAEQTRSIINVERGSGYESVFGAACKLGRFRELSSATIAHTIRKAIAKSDQYANWQHMAQLDTITQKGIKYGRRHLYE